MKNVILCLITILMLNPPLFSQENTWVQKASLLDKRERAVGFSLLGKGYIGTGTNTSEETLNDFWQYDPSSDTWSQVANLPSSPRRNAIAFTIDNKAYVGTGNDHDTASVGNYLSDIWEYDPIENTWLEKAPYPGGSGTGIYFGTGFSIQDKGYICCGKRGPNDYLTELWEFNPNTDSWTFKSNFPGGVRNKLCSFVVNNKAYIGLGEDNDIYRKDIWEYNPQTNSWIEKNDFAGEQRGEVCTFVINNTGFIATGSNGAFWKDNWEYNAESDSWNIRADFGGSARRNAVAFVINNHAYLVSGKGYDGKKRTMYRYRPYQYVMSNNQNENINLRIFPNPVFDYFIIQTNQNLEGYIVDVQGKIVSNFITHSNETKIERNGLVSGLYILILKDENKIIHQEKLIFN